MDYRLDGNALQWRTRLSSRPSRTFDTEWKDIYGLFKDFISTKEFTIVTDNADKIASLKRTIDDAKKSLEQAEKQILELK